MAEHKHGSMNTDVQEKVFGGFVKAVGWGAFLSMAFLVFLAIVNG